MVSIILEIPQNASKNPRPAPHRKKPTSGRLQKRKAAPFLRCCFPVWSAQLSPR
ncbi:hypothetical protein SUBVAR_06550 [Subdoligranulum variabile DSM 15176]|uniref:Uncharacterized protein n=1 Tax=Subdoligranulum variabile DSM 15176 TaxID=411471 RepID=D1PQ82_9FIRM|nr:hypothetical protein SUBVAR_06550 [Subdoligranulum variabile DSM 15176]